MAIPTVDALGNTNQGVNFPENPAAGTTVTVTSKFKNTGPAGHYVLDTEVFDSRKARVAQFAETVWLQAGQSTTRSYRWNTRSRSAGTYRASQGVFTDKWARLVEWRSNSGSVQLSGGKQPWSMTARTSTSGTTVTVKSSFKTTAAGHYLLDTEIYDDRDRRVAQFAEERWVNANSSTEMVNRWTGESGRHYTVRQGAFSPGWRKNLAWSSLTARFTLSGSRIAADAAPAAPRIARPTTTTTRPPAPAAKPTPTPKAPETRAASSRSHGNVLNGARFFGGNTGAAKQAEVWRHSRPADAALMARLAGVPSATWLGDWSGDVTATTSATLDQASAAGQVPVFVVYNIPGRDCGQYSAGGKNSADAYNAWIDRMANGIRGRKAVFVLEPDALGLMTCLSPSDQNARYSMLSNATRKLSAAGAYVYIEASSWIEPSTMARQLERSNVADAHGFAINVSGYNPTSAMHDYGAKLSQATGGKHYVIDTSRSGSGSNGEWCNPHGRSLGPTPTTNTGVDKADAYLWIKTPGESDGTCNGGPSAGVFWPDYALGMAQRAWK